MSSNQTPPRFRSAPDCPARPDRAKRGPHRLRGHGQLALDELRRNGRTPRDALGTAWAASGLTQIVQQNPEPKPIEWDEEKAKPTETSVSTEPAVEEDSSTLTAH